MGALRLAALGSFCICFVTIQPTHAASFRWAADGDVTTLDPYSRQETFQISFLSNIYEPLARRTPDLGLEPALATRWEQTSPTTWRFHLRPDVTWQDGSPFTADDVVFSLGRIQSPKSSMRVTMAPVREARKIDALTVEFETSVPDPILPQEQAQFLIMSKAWAERNNTVEPAVIGRESGYALRNAMGTGPFQLTAREPDRQTVLAPNPRWWDTPKHNLDRVEFNVIGTAATRLAALLSGEIDMNYAVAPQDIARIRQTPGLRLFQTAELRTMYLGFNIGRDELPSSDVKGRNPFRDLRVREAVNLAIDRAAIASRIMLGLGQPTGVMWGPGVNGYDAALDTPTRPDPARAKQLLAEAGLPNGFAVTLDCSDDRYLMDEQICTALTAMLARIGVRVDLLAQTKGKFFTKILAPNFDSDFWMLGWTPPSYDAHAVLLILFATRNGERGEANIGAYSNPALDRLIAAIGTEIDPAKRNGMIRESAGILQRDLPAAPLHRPAIVWAAKANIDLVQPADNSFPLRYVRVREGRAP